MLTKAKEKDINSLYNFISESEIEFDFHLNNLIAVDGQLNKTLTKRTIRNAIFSEELDLFYIKNNSTDKIDVLFLLLYPISIRHTTAVEIGVTIKRIDFDKKINLISVFDNIPSKYTKITIRGNDDSVRLIKNTYQCDLELIIPNSFPSYYYGFFKEKTL